MAAFPSRFGGFHHNGCGCGELRAIAKTPRNAIENRAQRTLYFPCFTHSTLNRAWRIVFRGSPFFRWFKKCEYDT
jgi:hypothetical protein